MKMKTQKAIMACAEMMVKMLELGFRKQDIPELEKIFWRTHNHRTGEVKRNPQPK